MSRARETLEALREKLDALERRIGELAGRIDERRLADLRARAGVVRDDWRAALAAGAALSDERLLALGHAVERLAREVAEAERG